MWNDPLAMQAFRVTALYAALTILLTFVVPIIVAILLMEMPRHVMRWMMLLWFIPLSLLASTLVFRYMYNTQYGIFQWVATDILHLPPQPFLNSADAGQFLDRLSRSPLLRPRADLHGDAARDSPLLLRGGRDRRRRLLAQDLDDLDPATAPRHLDAAHLRAHRQLASLRTATDHDRGGPGGASRTVVLYLYTLLQQLRFADATALGVYLFLAVMAHRRRSTGSSSMTIRTRRAAAVAQPLPAAASIGARDARRGRCATSSRQGSNGRQTGGLSMLFPAVGRQQRRVRDRLVGHRGHPLPRHLPPPGADLHRADHQPEERLRGAALSADLVSPGADAGGLAAGRRSDLRRQPGRPAISSIGRCTSSSSTRCSSPRSPCCIGIPITSFAAYANSKLQRGAIARWSFIFFIGTLMMPTALTLIPSYLLTRNWPFALPQVPLIPGTETRVPDRPHLGHAVGGDPAHGLQRLQFPPLQGLLRHHPRFGHPGGAGRWRQRVQHLPPHRPADEHPGLRRRGLESCSRRPGTSSSGR